MACAVANTGCRPPERRIVFGFFVRGGRCVAELRGAGEL